MSRVGASFAQNSSGVIFPRGQLRANSNATPIIERCRPSVNAGDALPRHASYIVDNSHNSLPCSCISHFLSTTSWLYKNNSCIFIYLLALNAAGKTFSFVFNNLLASFVILAFLILGSNPEILPIFRSEICPRVSDLVAVPPLQIRQRASALSRGRAQEPATLGF